MVSLETSNGRDSTQQQQGISVTAGTPAIGGVPAATGCQGHLSISNSREAFNNMGSRDANSRKIIFNSRVDFSSKGMAFLTPTAADRLYQHAYQQQ